ncbi:MAG: phosphonate C-P lyase system protein PhnH [Pseudomonadota bacterium]
MQLSENNSFKGGFQSPVFDAQQGFNLAMQAMSRPGTVQQVPAIVAPPAPLNDATGLLALTLFDADTAVFIAPALKTEDVVTWLRFHTGAPIIDNKAEAQFALLDDISALQCFELFALGTQEYPDRSTTLIAQVDGFDDQSQWQLSGPGINGTTSLSPKGCGDISSTWAHNNALFPRGVDLFLAAPRALAALPRTTKLTMAGEL